MNASSLNRRYWSIEEEETLKRMVLSGSSLNEIANTINRTPMAVILHTRVLSGLERSNVKHRMPEDYYDQTKTISQVAPNRGRSWTAADNAQLQKMFDNGKNIFEIAEFFSRTPTAIIKQIEKINDTPEKKTALFQKAKFLMGKKRVQVQSEQVPNEYTYKYPRPAVTADCVVITKEAEPKVLLIQRGNEPFKGHWAFPGGYMEMDETTERCAIRELQEETGLTVNAVLQIGAYSKVDRDPRGRTLTVAYLALIDSPANVQGLDDAANAVWHSINDLPPLAFDHDEIMKDAINLYLHLTQK